MNYFGHKKSGTTVYVYMPLMCNHSCTDKLCINVYSTYHSFFMYVDYLAMTIE